MQRNTSDDRFDIRSVRDGIAKLYAGGDREAARNRSAHFNSVARLTPFTMAANVISGILVLWVFHDSLSTGLWLWFGLMVAVSMLATWDWRRRRHGSEVISRGALRWATRHAVTLAAVWAVALLVWFPRANGAQQLALATLIGGMLGAGTFLLSPLPRASMAYASIYTGASLAALWLTGNPQFAPVAVLLCLYAPSVVLGSLSSWHRATVQLNAKAEAVRREHLLMVLLQDFEQHAGEALWETDRGGHLTHLSPRLAELLDVNEGDIRQLPFMALLQRHHTAGAETLQQTLETGHSFRDLALSRSDHNGTVHLAINGKCLFDDDGRLLGWRGVLADATGKVEGQRRLLQLAHTDSLTGLANRFTFREALAEELKLKRGGALLTIDLDQFKIVNDSLGHSAGDELLVAVAKRLQSLVRPQDLVARLGGDEFSIIMSRLAHADAAEALAHRLIGAVRAPVEISAGRRLSVAASVGVVLWGNDEVGAEDILGRSDAALHEAKASGRGCCTIYSPQLGERRHRRLYIEDSLRHVVERGELALYWQPQVNIGTGQVTGAEALMRWDHPQLGTILPTEFIAIAEQCGAIAELGLWALREACAAAADPLAGLVVSVNVSSLQLHDGSLVDHVHRALDDFHLPPAQLELELTESVFLGDADGALAQLHTLRSMGVRVALDDFGIGYSSLAYLRRFPFDTLKIDRSFVTEVVDRHDVFVIVKTIAQMATALGMRTVCEGVESPQQMAAVAEAGCTDIQGYLTSAPRPLADFLRLRSTW